MMHNSFQQQQQDQREEAQKRTMPLREYWLLYLALIATGIMTAFAGVYLGLSPDKTGQIHFQDMADAVRRVFFAIYYAGTFLLVAEGATLFAKDKLLQRDVEVVDDRIVDILAQRRSMTAMLYVSVMAIVATTVAAGTMLASWLGALDQFVTIPVVAQNWVVLGPPALLVFDIVMALIYQQNSKKSEIDRYVEQQKRMAEAAAQEAWARTYVDEYNKAAPQAARAAAVVAAQKAARKWSGAGVDSVTPVHDQTDAEKKQAYITPPEDIARHNQEYAEMRKFPPFKHEVTPGYLHEVMEEPKVMDETPPPGSIVIPNHHTPVMEAYVQPEATDQPAATEDPGHGNVEPVVEENAITPEGGADQGSPT